MLASKVARKWECKNFMYNFGCKKNCIRQEQRHSCERGMAAGAPGDRVQGAANGRQNRYIA